MRFWTAQDEWGGDRGLAVLPPGTQPAGSRLQALHVGAAGQQAAPLLTGRLHTDSANYAAPGAGSTSMAPVLVRADGLIVLGGLS